MTSSLGSPSSPNAVWLRDNCACPRCRDPRNGQKLHSVTDIDPGVRGPMDAAEVAAFEAEPYGPDAVRLRRWDDEGKDPARPAPGFDDFAPLLASLVVP